jgi:hypothetical protein
VIARRGAARREDHGNVRKTGRFRGLISLDTRPFVVAASTPPFVPSHPLP